MYHTPLPLTLLLVVCALVTLSTRNQMCRDGNVERAVWETKG